MVRLSCRHSATGWRFAAGRQRRFGGGGTVFLGLRVETAAAPVRHAPVGGHGRLAGRKKVGDDGNASMGFMTPAAVVAAERGNCSVGFMTSVAALRRRLADSLLMVFSSVMVGEGVRLEKRGDREVIGRTRNRAAVDIKSLVLKHGMVDGGRLRHERHGEQTFNGRSRRRRRIDRHPLDVAAIMVDARTWQRRPGRRSRDGQVRRGAGHAGAGPRRDPGPAMLDLRAHGGVAATRSASRSASVRAEPTERRPTLPAMLSSHRPLCSMSRAWVL